VILRRIDRGFAQTLSPSPLSREVVLRRWRTLFFLLRLCFAQALARACFLACIRKIKACSRPSFIWDKSTGTSASHERRGLSQCPSFLRARAYATRVFYLFTVFIFIYLLLFLLGHGTRQYK
jgi:hypothetical protein